MRAPRHHRVTLADPQVEERQYGLIYPVAYRVPAHPAPAEAPERTALVTEAIPEQAPTLQQPRSRRPQPHYAAADCDSVEGFESRPESHRGRNTVERVTPPAPSAALLFEHAVGGFGEEGRG